MFGKTFGKYFSLIALILMVLIAVMQIFVPLSTNKVFATSQSAFAVLDGDTFTLLCQSNCHAKLPMASTTKIMTALLALENKKTDEKVTVTKEMTGIEGSSVYLKEGEILTIKELLYCLMLRSGNDSAVALAIAVSGSIDGFASMMNERAESMNLLNTHFVNPHGLHDDNHYTSAYDLAYIAAIAMKNPVFRDIVSTKKITVGEGESQRYLLNKNKMLLSYDGANGIKTGYTKKSGRCLVSSATKNGRTLICVVLNYGDTYGLSKQLLDKGFDMIQSPNA